MSADLPDDPSVDWEGVAARFAALRSDVGVDVVLRWSAQVAPRGAIVDVGCGTGVPIATALAGAGFAVHGIDPSPTQLAAFRRNLPGAPAACEAAEASDFFDRRFDGAVAIGVLFLLSEDTQRAVIGRIGRALNSGAHFLFSAPRRACEWDDSLTGRRSRSLGEVRYRDLLAAAGCRLAGHDRDAGGNDYFHAVADGVRQP